MKSASVLKICTWAVLLFLLFSVSIVAFFGCSTYLDAFANEDYVWEGWAISTNKVEVIPNGQ